MRDFSLRVYQKLLHVFLDNAYTLQTFEEFIENPVHKAIVLRHDVDKLPNNSLCVAKIEHELGINGTYYFRIVAESYDENIIKQIAELGHEVGYHYEDVSLVTKGLREGGTKRLIKVMIERLRDLGTQRLRELEKQRDALIDLAVESFCRNLEKFREIYPVKTICMHGSPLSKYDNRLLWGKYDYRDFGIIGEPYFDVDFSEVLYLTDTGRRWDGGRVSVRDRVTKRQSDLETKGRKDEEKKSGSSSGSPVRLSIDDCLSCKELVTVQDRLTNKKNKEEKLTLNEKLGLRFRGTQDIIDAAYTGLLPDRIMITVHPQRWGDSFFPWARELVWQNFKNVVKWGVVKVND